MVSLNSDVYVARLTFISYVACERQLTSHCQWSPVTCHSLCGCHSRAHEAVRSFLAQAYEAPCFPLDSTHSCHSTIITYRHKHHVFVSPGPDIYLILEL